MNRLIKDGKITTIVGLAAIGGAIYMYLNQNFTTVEAGELGALGLVFLRSKDSLLNLGPKESK